MLWDVLILVLASAMVFTLAVAVVSMAANQAVLALGGFSRKISLMGKGSATRVTESIHVQ